MLNPPKRMIYLEPLPCCCVSVGTSAIAWKTGGRIQNSPVLSGQLRSCLYIGWNVSLVIEIIVGVAIICIVALQLTKSTNAGSQCLLGNHDYSRNRLCIYSYIVAGSGIVAASTLVILLVRFTSYHSNLMFVY